jgi:hypothetical protein
LAKKIRVWDTPVGVAYEQGICAACEVRAWEAEWDGKEQEQAEEAEEEGQERDEAEEDRRVGMNG